MATKGLKDACSDAGIAQCNSDAGALPFEHKLSRSVEHGMIDADLCDRADGANGEILTTYSAANARSACYFVQAAGVRTLYCVVCLLLLASAPSCAFRSAPAAGRFVPGAESAGNSARKAAGKGQKVIIPPPPSLHISPSGRSISRPSGSPPNTMSSNGPHFDIFARLSRSWCVGRARLPAAPTRGPCWIITSPGHPFRYMYMVPVDPV